MVEHAAQEILLLPDEAATKRLGARLAACCPPGTVIHLAGELGAGKSTLARGLIRALGHTGAVRSPTFTLLEPYEELEPPVVHLDLYRLTDPEELEFLGLRDYLSGDAILLVEWPQRGRGHLPGPDLEVELRPWGVGRRACLAARTARGARCLGDRSAR
jgi:tRNA threonylcarbamoyladenosine biosynthesis protein TsaE